MTLLIALAVIALALAAFAGPLKAHLGLRARYKHDVPVDEIERILRASDPPEKRGVRPG